MILKSFEINKVNQNINHLILFYGKNEGLKNETLNLLIKNKGGICAINDTTEKVVALPVAGIMSDKPAEIIGKAYAELDAMAKEMGSNLSAPFMTLSFMALLVIPSLKLSDRGLFDVSSFNFTSLEVV